ncbi:MAG: arylsulfatase [Chthoniobacteraceae bacterium]
MTPPSPPRYRLAGFRIDRGFLVRILIALLVALAITARGADRPPNIVFILADDLGYGELGCFGQKKIATPEIDRLAAQGVRFPQFYAGSTVCAPSRSVLMTGKHLGHTRVRGNAGRNNPQAQSLRAEDVTVAEVLKKAGYATALIGKWGLGREGDEGHPSKQGFDYFFGYLDQTHAHNFYPEFLIRNDQRVPLKNKLQRNGKPYEEVGAGLAVEKVEFSHDLFAADALRWVEEQREKPFFLYLALTIPHANNEANQLTGDGSEVPDYGSYADKPWSPQQKGHAAKIERMDRDVGRLVAKIAELGLSENTLIIFTSDNGAHKEGGFDPAFFNASGPLRGIKRAMYEGGIRVPTVAYWPGKIAPGRVSEHVGYFGDFMATAAELAGTPAPAGIDSISFVPELRGETAKQSKHTELYWEFHEGGFHQAALLDGRWKAVRRKSPSEPIELYDLKADLAEKNDLAAAHPEIVGRAGDFLKTAHEKSTDWPIRALDPAKSPTR